MRTRRGFSFIEILMVFTIFGLVVAITLPRFNYVRAGSNVRAAKVQISSQLASARAAAIRRGRSAQFHAAADSIWVTVDSAGVQRVLIRKLGLGDAYDVSLSATNQTITFDSRGLVTDLAATAKYVLTRGERRDSVCVSRLGVDLRRGCVL